MSQFLPILCVVRQSKIDPRRVGREINIVFIYFQYKRSIRALFNLAIAFWKKGQMGQLSLMSCSCHYIVFTERTTECRVNYFFRDIKKHWKYVFFLPPSPHNAACPVAYLCEHGCPVSGLSDRCGSDVWRSACRVRGRPTVSTDDSQFLAV